MTQMTIEDWTVTVMPFDHARPQHTNRLTLKCGFCGKHFTAPAGERLAASIRHLESCARAQARIDRWYPGEKRARADLRSIADSYFTWREIIGTFKPGIKCDARCQGAIGHDCECSCNGRNHGIGISA